MGKAANSFIARVRTAVVLAAVVAAGLLVRPALEGYLPPLAAKAAGDALWTVAVLLVFRFVNPGAESPWLAAAAFAFAALVEVSQLSRAPWLEDLRATPLWLLLGHGFHVTDFLWYAAGASVGVGLDHAARLRAPT